MQYFVTTPYHISNGTYYRKARPDIRLIHEFYILIFGSVFQFFI